MMPCEIDMWTKYTIVIYMMVGVYVATRSLDYHIVEDHSIYSIVAMFLTVVWPLVIVYILLKKFIDKC